MNEFQDFTRKFSNNRQWREFVSAVQSVTYPSAVTYPKVISAFRSGRDWLPTFPDANRYCTEQHAGIPPA
jgi:hypothetical protein